MVLLVLGLNTQTDLQSISPHHKIMSGPATVQANPSKRICQNNDSSFAAVIGGSATNGSAVGGGYAAACDASSGNAKKAAMTLPLSATLALKVTFIESLPIASQPFLTPLAEFVLRKFACHFYAEEKARETKSNPNYVSSSAKKTCDFPPSNARGARESGFQDSL